MTAAILCPGPSLGKWPAETWNGYDLRIGVNRGVRVARCEWWAFIDHKQITENQPPDYFPRAFTTEISLEAIARRGRDAKPYNPFQVEHCDYLPRRPINWALFSMTAAIVLGAWLGATEIHLYGNDRTDAPDYDGHNSKGDVRDAARWSREAFVFDPLVEELNRRGANVRRMTI